MDKDKIKELGMRMPGEFEAHHGTIMIWPKRPGSWKKDPSKVGSREALSHYKN